MAGYRMADLPPDSPLTPSPLTTFSATLSGPHIIEGETRPFLVQQLENLAMNDLPQQDDAVFSESRPPGLPDNYPMGPTTTSAGQRIPEGMYLCDCGKLLSVASWSKNGRKHEKSNHHVVSCGLQPYVSENTTCPGCNKNFRSDALRRHLEKGKTTCSDKGFSAPRKFERRTPSATSPEKSPKKSRRSLPKGPRVTSKIAIQKADEGLVSPTAHTSARYSPRPPSQDLSEPNKSPTSPEFTANGLNDPRSPSSGPRALLAPADHTPSFGVFASAPRFQSMSFPSHNDGRPSQPDYLVPSLGSSSTSKPSDPCSSNAAQSTASSPRERSNRSLHTSHAAAPPRPRPEIRIPGTDYIRSRHLPPSSKHLSKTTSLTSMHCVDATSTHGTTSPALSNFPPPTPSSASSLYPPYPVLFSMHQAGNGSQVSSVPTPSIYVEGLPFDSDSCDVPQNQIQIADATYSPGPASHDRPFEHSLALWNGMADNGSLTPLDELPIMSFGETSMKGPAVTNDCEMGVSSADFAFPQDGYASGSQPPSQLYLPYAPNNTPATQSSLSNALNDNLFQPPEHRTVYDASQIPVASTSGEVIIQEADSEQGYSYFDAEKFFEKLLPSPDPGSYGDDFDSGERPQYTSQDYGMLDDYDGRFMSQGAA